jgi:ligand-binding sensor domain-containing protein
MGRATYGLGLNTFTQTDGLGHDAVRGICEDKDGNLWIGTRGGGLSRFRNGRFTGYTERDGLASNNVQALYMAERILCGLAHARE